MLYLQQISCKHPCCSGNNSTIKQNKCKRIAAQTSCREIRPSIFNYNLQNLTKQSLTCSTATCCLQPSCQRVQCMCHQWSSDWHQHHLVKAVFTVHCCGTAVKYVPRLVNLFLRLQSFPVGLAFFASFLSFSHIHSVCLFSSCWFILSASHIPVTLVLALSPLCSPHISLPFLFFYFLHHLFPQPPSYPSPVHFCACLSCVLWRYFWPYTGYTAYQAGMLLLHTHAVV